MEVFSKNMMENNRLKIKYSREGYLGKYVSEKILAGMNGRDIPKLINGLILNRIIERISCNTTSEIVLDARFFSNSDCLSI